MIHYMIYQIKADNKFKGDLLYLPFFIDKVNELDITLQQITGKK